MMTTGKELVLRALHFEPVERTPWVPFTGVHSARLLEQDATTYLQDASSIVRGVTLAAERTLADGVCSVFDLQVEAEVLGCRLKWSPNNPPAVASHILEEGKALADLPALAKDQGRIPLCLEATRELVRTIGDRLAVFSLLCGPFTLALHLAGQSFLTDLIEKPEYAQEILRFCSDTSCRLAAWYLETGSPVVAIVDPMTSQISPRHFRKFVAPCLEPVIATIREKGGIASLFCCGDATKNIELMMQCGPHSVAFDEQVDLALVRNLAKKHHVSFEGNMPLTTTLLFGSPLECARDAAARLEIGGKEGYILSPGCDLPFHTPLYNLEAVGRFVRFGELPQETAGFISLDQALSAAEESGEELPPVEIVPGRVFIEIVTLDSEGCAPCQYMCEAVRSVEKHYGKRLLWRETLIKSLAGIRRTQKLGVSTLPTLLINNEIVFDNLVPTREELIREIDRRLSGPQQER